LRDKHEGSDLLQWPRGRDRIDDIYIGGVEMVDFG
jgi:hypothetical protein